MTQTTKLAFDRPIWLWVLLLSYGGIPLTWGQTVYVPATVVLSLLCIFDSSSYAQAIRENREYHASHRAKGNFHE